MLARFATPSEISKELSVMVARSQFDDFEFGVESRFERTFSEFLRRYGVVAQDASVRWIAANADKNSPVAVRMVLVLGGEREGVSSEGRYHLLTWLLQSSSAAVRDAAARTLFRVPDPRVREALKTAAEQESNSRVKRFISQLADRITADL
ncbi:MAG: HEAT repeat domain-containing protein [Gemmatimonadota bacterium]